MSLILMFGNPILPSTYFFDLAAISNSNTSSMLEKDLVGSNGEMRTKKESYGILIYLVYIVPFE